MKHVDYEGTRRLTTVHQPHEDRLYVQQDSEEFETLLKERNAQMRQVEQSGNVRLQLQMSEQDYAQLLRQHPLLATGTTAQRRALWEQVAKDHPHLVAVEFKPRLHPTI